MKAIETPAGQWIEFHYQAQYCVGDLVGSIWCFVPKASKP